jgi:hypothetical protein
MENCDGKTAGASHADFATHAVARSLAMPALADALEGLPHVVSPAGAVRSMPSICRCQHRAHYHRPSVGSVGGQAHGGSYAAVCTPRSRQP